MHPLNGIRRIFSAVGALLAPPSMIVPTSRVDVEPRRLEPFLGEPMPRPMANFPDMPLTPMVKRHNPKRDAQKAQRKARKISRRH